MRCTMRNVYNYRHWIIASAAQFSNDNSILLHPSCNNYPVLFPGKSKQRSLAVYADGNETSAPRKEEDPLKSNKVYAHEQFNDGKLYRTE